MSSKINLKLSDRAIALQETLLIIDDAVYHIKNGFNYFDRVLAPAIFSLVVNTNTNHPLLIDMAKEFKVNLDIEFNDPPPRGIHKVNFHDYMSELAWASGTHQEKLSRTEFISHFRNKRSIAHQDPAVSSEIYHSSSMDGWGIGGTTSEAYTLVGISEIVIMLSYRVVQASKMGKK